MQYSIQGLNCEDAARKDLLMDIGTEELSHLEIVGTLARLHLKPMKSVREEAEADPLIAIADTVPDPKIQNSRDAIIKITACHSSR